VHVRCVSAESSMCAARSARSMTILGLNNNIIAAENNQAPLNDDGDVFRTSKEVLDKFRSRAHDLLSAHPAKQLILSFLGGAFITFGAAVAVALSEGSQQGAYRVYLALGFMTGFVALVLSGAAAFTEVSNFFA
jgi:hypothetical protein